MAGVIYEKESSYNLFKNQMVLLTLNYIPSKTPFLIDMAWPFYLNNYKI
jgi:hypothetical protein